MASDELDLEYGDSAAESPAATRRRLRREKAAENATASGKGGKSGSGASDKISTEIRRRLERVFDRTVKWRQARGDDELAEALTEDGEMMTDAVISITDTFNPLRVPTLLALAIVEPLLAFGRVFRILMGRFLARRAGQEQEQEQEYMPENGGTPAGVYEFEQ